jgi:undecaprenyl-diphosphatase
VELLFKSRNRGEEKDQDKGLSYEKAFVVGLFQSLAVIPGVSRSASSIIGGMLLGLSRNKATEFSFLLAVPTMLAATALDLKETSFSFNSGQLIVLAVGFFISFAVALIAVKWLLTYVRTNDFIPFGVYRIALSVLYFLFILN